MKTINTVLLKSQKEINSYVIVDIIDKPPRKSVDIFWTIKCDAPMYIGRK